MNLDEAVAVLAGKLIHGDEKQIAALQHIRAVQQAKELAEAGKVECASCNGLGECLRCGVECGTCDGTGEIDSSDFESMSTNDLKELIAENTP